MGRAVEHVYPCVMRRNMFGHNLMYRQTALTDEYRSEIEVEVNDKDELEESVAGNRSSCFAAKFIVSEVSTSLWSSLASKSNLA